MRLIRVGFTKQNEACYISHLDLQRAMQRALKKAGVPVWYTQGFNPHIYLTFPLPLSLGQSSVCECVDYKCEDDVYDPEAVFANLNAAMPRGITVYDVHEAEMDPNEIEYARYKIRLEGESGALLEKLAAFRSLPEAIVIKKTKKGKDNPVDMMAGIREWKAEAAEFGAELDVVLPAGNRFTLNPDLICSWLTEHYEVPAVDMQICRVAVYNKQMENFR